MRILQEIDLALAAFANTFGIYHFAIYLAGDGHGMLVKYPMPQTAIDAPIKVFSLYVSLYITYNVLSVPTIGTFRL